MRALFPALIDWLLFFVSLVGHLVYGVVTALGFLALERRVQPLG